MTAKKRSYTKIALTLSICLMLLWGILGATTSLAWFTDTSPVQKNVFNVGELDLVVSHKREDGKYYEIDSTTTIFDDEALYEPGYVQVVYLRVENRGEIPFDYRSALMINDYTPAYNVFGSKFNLQDHLRFGVVSAETEAELIELVKNRILAKGQASHDLSGIANLPAGKYTTDVQSLNVREEHYLALIVRMPEEVGNIANYRGNDVPTVKLGLSVNASQKGTPVE